jgi:MHS family proline/betaine transporter-like MFS transporter
MGGALVTNKNILSCFIGNVFEWYDFALYGYLAGIFAQLFFPTTDPLIALLSSYGVFAAGFVMRPLGAVILGHIGDLHGRKKALTFSVLFMSLPTALIGCLPSYDSIGLWAPILLFTFRLIQGFSLGGEFSGSIVLLIEHAPAEKKASYGAWSDLGSSVGMILASLTVILLQTYCSPEFLLTWGWRLPFISGLAFAIIGFKIRQNLEESPIFSKKEKLNTIPLHHLFSHHFSSTLTASCFLAINTIGYYILIVFIPTQHMSNLSAVDLSLLTLCSLIVMMPANFFAARLSDKIGHTKVVMAGYALTALLAYPLLLTSIQGSFLQQITIQSAFAIALGFCFGPRSAILASLFPTNVRYTGVSLSYNLGNALFGGTAPFMSAFLISSTNLKTSPAVYIIVASFISLLSLFFMGRWHKKEKAREATIIP